MDKDLLAEIKGTLLVIKGSIDKEIRIKKDSPLHNRIKRLINVLKNK